MFERVKSRRAMREFKKAAEDLQRLGTNPENNLDSQVANMLAQGNPDGVPADEAPNEVRAMVKALLPFVAFALSPSEQDKLSVSTTSQVMERAELKDGRYYFR